MKADEPNNAKPRRFEKNWKRTKGKKNLKVKKESEIKLINENDEKENEIETKAEEEKKEVKKNRRRRRPQKQTEKIDTEKNEVFIILFFCINFIITIVLFKYNII